MPRIRIIPSLMLASGLALGLPSIALAQQTPPQPPLPPSASEEEPIFGSQMMTDQERNEYRMRMHDAASAEDRARIRDEHHAEMVERARERGITLPEEPPGQSLGRGPGTGPGPGMGMGGSGMMGPGQGMGPGRGMGSGQRTAPVPEGGPGDGTTPDQQP